MSLQKTYATGRRKTAIARVWLYAGAGKFTINDRSDEDYFSRPTARMVIRQALEEVALLANYDVTATVVGGGIASQERAQEVRSEGRTRALPVQQALSAFAVGTKASLRRGLRRFGNQGNFRGSRDACNLRKL